MVSGGTRQAGGLEQTFISLVSHHLQAPKEAIVQLALLARPWLRIGGYCCHSVFDGGPDVRVSEDV